MLSVCLAVAEEELSFEHRDLHWGNVLIRHADFATLHRTAVLIICSLFLAPYSSDARSLQFTAVRFVYLYRQGPCYYGDFPCCKAEHSPAHVRMAL